MAHCLALLCLRCTPADRVPEPSPERQQRIVMLSQTFSGIAAGRAEAPGALADQLAALTAFPPAPAASTALAEALNAALPGAALDDAQVLAKRVYAAMNGGYLRQPDLARLLAAVDAQLRQAGVSEMRRQEVTGALRRVAREPADPRTDWW